VAVGDKPGLIGEYRSTATLELYGGQQAMLETLATTGKPIILVSIASKPLIVPDCVREAEGIIQALNPGMRGGQAIAEILMGKENPSGRLTVSMPYHVGQQPVFYSQVRGQHGDRYADMTQQPHFAFGYGLSYTEFSYGELSLEQSELGLSDTLKFSIEVTNIGSLAGKEVVQVYVSDLVTSVTWVQKELKGYRKLDLAAGETQRLPFHFSSIKQFV